jgi:hypothetical protein
MGAVGPGVENHLESPFVTVWRKRVMWLSCLFVAELATFTALSHFEDAIEAVVVLALFVPLCISTGGTIGVLGTRIKRRITDENRINLFRDEWEFSARRLSRRPTLTLTGRTPRASRTWKN